MSDIDSRIIKLNDEDLTWQFDGSPYFKVKVTEGTKYSDYNTFHNIDTFPCYSHDIELVKECATKAESIFNFNPKPIYIIMPFESTGRTNGQAEKYNIGNDKYIPIVVLWGKRIPIMPNMTNYLYHHELSHCVDYQACSQLKLEDSGLDEEYAKWRGIKNSSKYGARNWHTQTGEIIANDIRVSLFGAEPQFWPHKCPHPDTKPEIKDYWMKFSAKMTEGNGF